MVGETIDLTSYDGLKRLQKAQEYTAEQMESYVVTGATRWFKNLLVYRAGVPSVDRRHIPTAWADRSAS